MLRTLACALLLVLATPAPTNACNNDGYAESYPKVKALHAADLKKLLRKKGTVLIDVNRPEFRERFGTLPGAKYVDPLSFDPQRLEARPSAPLVFFCTNMRCEMSWKAAEQARAAGYKNVGVLIHGLLGWKHEGGKTQTVPAKY